MCFLSSLHMFTSFHGFPCPGQHPPGGFPEIWGHHINGGRPTDPWDERYMYLHEWLNVYGKCRCIYIYTWYMGVEPKIGVFPPILMVYNNGKPYLLMDDLGVPLFSETSIYIYIYVPVAWILWVIKISDWKTHESSARYSNGQRIASDFNFTILCCLVETTRPYQWNITINKILTNKNTVHTRSTKRSSNSLDPYNHLWNNPHING